MRVRPTPTAWTETRAQFQKYIADEGNKSSSFQAKGLERRVSGKQKVRIRSKKDKCLGNGPYPIIYELQGFTLSEHVWVRPYLENQRLRETTSQVSNYSLNGGHKDCTCIVL